MNTVENQPIASENNPPSVLPVKTGGSKKIVVPLIIGLAALFIGIRIYGSYKFGQTHVETDNAYVTGDLVGISPSVSGTLVELTVQDGDFVRKGRLIARLDPAEAQAEYDQAYANLLSAKTQVPAAQVALTFEKLSTEAAVRRSQAAIASQQAKISGSRLQVRLSSDTVREQVIQAQSQLEQAQAQLAQAAAGIDTARAEVASSRQAVVTAERTAAATSSAIGAMQADEEKSSKDLARYKKLLASEAITQQQFDSAVATSKGSEANLASSNERATAATSEVQQAKNSVVQAQTILIAAERQRDVAAKQVEAARAGVDLARSGGTQIGIKGTDVTSNVGQASQALADLGTAKAGFQEVSLRERQIETAKAQVQLAEATVRRARVHLLDANLYAPCDGHVVKHSANVGSSINPGQTVVTITRGNQLWVMANFKETQLTNVREGQPAEVEVDAFPGKKFRGRVMTIIGATGSAITLLPPDNATGNFTKIVQRVPVKISLEGDSSGDADLTRIKQGMSVSATIDTSGNPGEN